MTHWPSGRRGRSAGWQAGGRIPSISRERQGRDPTRRRNRDTAGKGSSARIRGLRATLLAGTVDYTREQYSSSMQMLYEKSALLASWSCGCSCVTGARRSWPLRPAALDPADVRCHVVVRFFVEHDHPAGAVRGRRHSGGRRHRRSREHRASRPRWGADPRGRGPGRDGNRAGGHRNDDGAGRRVPADGADERRGGALSASSAGQRSSRCSRRCWSRAC